MAMAVAEKGRGRMRPCGCGSVVAELQQTLLHRGGTVGSGRRWHIGRMVKKIECSDTQRGIDILFYIALL